MKRSRLIMMLILLFLIVGSLYLNFQFTRANDNPFGAKSFKVAKGDGVKTIAARLQSEGFLTSPFYFKAYVALKGLRAEFHEGEFDLATNLSLRDLARILTASGSTIKREIKLTIPEGWNAAQIGAYCEKQGLFSAKDFLAYINDFSDTASWTFLGDMPKSASLEGYLFPDTYIVYANAKPADLVVKMLKNFDDKMTNEWRTEIYRQKKTIFQVVTMASIVEKEMFGYENRRLVAGIFWKRLADHYPLQSDATVNYFTSAGVTRPSLEQLKIDNKYNTYKYAGLPPGPIANPSAEAIRAAIYSATSPYYFFLTTPDNQIIFSRTLAEHIKNRNKYLK
jgi:UPF0755 protein